MPIYNSPLLEIDTKEVRRYAGLRKSDFPESLIDEACLEGRLLAQPKGSWEIYDYDTKSQTVYDTVPFKIDGNKIGKHLENCTKVIIMSATVGEDIEEAVTKHFSEGRYAYSTLLDSAATTAVEQIADNMEKYLKPMLARQGLAMKWRFSPGYGDWPIEQQPELLRLSKASLIGVSLTESFMLYPRKSITAIIGLYPKEMECPNDKGFQHDCTQCSKLDCISRKSDIEK